MKALSKLSAALLVATTGPAFAVDDNTTYGSRELPNITCTNDGNGAFSFHMKTFDEPMVQVLSSFYNIDGNNLVYVNMHESIPETYEAPVSEDPNLKVSEQFAAAFAKFEGRFILFFNPSEDGTLECSIEEHFPDQNVVRRNFVQQVLALENNG
jgi:hypothetical protein